MAAISDAMGDSDDNSPICAQPGCLPTEKGCQALFKYYDTDDDDAPLLLRGNSRESFIGRQKMQDETLIRRDKLVQRYKKRAEHWEKQYIMMRRIHSRRMAALRALTADKGARLFYLHHQGELEKRIPEEARNKIGEWISTAYEEMEAEGDSLRLSEQSTDDDAPISGGAHS